MSNILLDCPHCSQHLEAPSDLAGCTIECPSCQKEFCIPWNIVQPVTTPIPMPNRKRPNISASIEQTLKSSSSKNTLKDKVHDTGGTYKYGNKSHYVGLSPIIIVSVSFFLPWLSISCNGKKMSNISGYKLLMTTISEQSGPDLSTSISQNWVLFGLLSILVLCIILSTFAVLAARQRNSGYVKYGACTWLLSIIMTLAIGYTLGVHAEGNLKEEQMTTLSSSSGGPFGAAMGEAMNITIHMDAGYYLCLAAFFLGLGTLVVPFYLNQGKTQRTVLVSSIGGGIAGLGFPLCLGICLSCLAHPPHFRDPNAIDHIFDDAHVESGSVVSKSQGTEDEYKGELPDLFVGLRLGCSIEKTRIDMNAVSVAKSNPVTSSEEEGDDYTITLDGNPNFTDASSTTLTFWKGRLMKVSLNFTGFDADLERHYAVLRHMVSEKYGYDKQTVSMRDDYAVWRAAGLKISLQHFSRWRHTATLHLVGEHIWLTAERERDELSRAAKQMGNL